MWHSSLGCGNFSMQLEVFWVPVTNERKKHMLSNALACQYKEPSLKESQGSLAWTKFEVG